MRLRTALLAAAFAAGSRAFAQPCPGDTAPRGLERSDLDTLPPRSVGLRRSVERDGARDEQTLTYGGWLLRDVLALAGFAEAGRRDDDSALGEQVYVIGSQDGRPLHAAAGPLALRSLADQRHGPRRMRNLCGLAVLPLPAR